MTEPSPVPGRTLILLRHAKAERGDGVADIDRTLTRRGQDDAVAAGAWLADQGNLPDQVLCSPSRRTRQSWEGVRLGIAQARAIAEEASSPDPIISYETDIYYGTAGDLLDLLWRVPQQTRTLLIIGHNPTISHISELLSTRHMPNRVGRGPAGYPYTGFWGRGRTYDRAPRPCGIGTPPGPAETARVRRVQGSQRTR